MLKEPLLRDIHPKGRAESNLLLPGTVQVVAGGLECCPIPRGRAIEHMSGLAAQHRAMYSVLESGSSLGPKSRHSRASASVKCGD